MVSEKEIFNRPAKPRLAVRAGSLLLAIILGLTGALFLGGALSSVGASLDADGDLDPTFGDDGTVTYTTGTEVEFLNDGQVAPDGKIVAAGAVGSGTTPRSTVIRANTDGSLDTSFGNMGRVTLDIGQFNDLAWATVVLSDGRIVVVGTADTNTPVASSIYVARLESDGDLDPTFNMTNPVTTPLGLGSAGYGVDVQADGKIVVAGASTNPATNVDFTLVRYNDDGSPDTTFGISGVVTTPITLGEDTAFAVKTQPDGKIVVAGRSNDGTLTNLVAAARYESDGQLDSSFGNNGVYTRQIGTVSQALAVEVQPDGKIVLVGSSGGPGFPPVQTLMVNRLEPDGSVDNTFGMTGVVTTPLSLGDSTATGVTFDVNARILVAGTGFGPVGSDFAVVRYDTDGTPDPTFGVTGVVTTEVEGGFDDASWIDVQTDGKIVVGGAAFDLSFTQGYMAIARYLGGPAIGLDERIYLPILVK